MKVCKAELGMAPSQEQESLVPRPERQIFFRFARENCCNYSQVGPWKKPHYCWALGNPCLLIEGKTCKWFVRAVLPLDPALEGEWRRLETLKANPNPLPWRKQERTCLCGVTFRPKSNRQLRCDKCAREHAKAEARNRKRRQRSRKGSAVTL